MNERLLMALSFFEDEGWPVQQSASNDALRLTLNVKGGSWTCYTFAPDGTTHIGFSAVRPDPIPEDRRAEMASFLIAANTFLPLGGFEIDPDTGQLRLRASVDFGTASPEPEMFAPLVRAVFNAAEDHLPMIDAIASGKTTAVDALADLRSGAAGIDVDTNDF